MGTRRAAHDDAGAIDRTRDGVRGAEEGCRHGAVPHRHPGGVRDG